MSNTLTRIETRIKHKIDSVGKWSEVEDTFIPLDGELVIYRGIIDNHSNETIHFKVGNGSSTLSSLPFAYDVELLEIANAIAKEAQDRAESDINLQEQITAIHTNTIPSTNITPAWGEEVNLGTVVSSDKSFKFTLPNETSVSISSLDTTSESISNRTFTAITGLTTTGSHGIIPEETTFTLPADQNTSHTHNAGVGLTGSGNAGTSGGVYTYKINLVNDNKSSNSASYTEGGSSKFYAVQLDKNNKLGVYVPWQNTQDGNQTIRVDETYFQSNDSIDIQGEGNITITADTNEPAVILSVPDDKYHITGSWSGLTYTATAKGDAEELSFTIPTGNTSTTVSPGDHTHDDSYISIPEKGASNGVATLDESGHILSTQLPSYVDDIINGQLSSTDGYFYQRIDNTEESGDITDATYEKIDNPERAKIYFDIITNKSYRYSGNDDSGKHIYVEIPSSLALSAESPAMDGTASVGTASTAARGDHVHPSDTSKLSLSGGTLTGNLTINDVSPGKKSYLTLPNLQSLRVGTAGNMNADPSYVATFINNKAENGFAYSKIDDIIKNSTMGQFNSYHGGNTFSDPNEATKSGIYYINGSTNRPPFPDNSAGAKDYNITVTTYSNDNNNMWCQQIARDYRSDYIFYRRCQKCVWQPWVKIFPQDIDGGTI